MALTLRSVVSAAREQVSSGIGDDTVILELRAGVYYGLDRVGTRVWELLREPRTVRDIRDRIVVEFDVDDDHARDDLLVLLGEMADRGLVEVRDEEDP